MPERKDQKRFDFEAALEELERLVGRLEKGDLPLEESLKEFERGVALTRSCQQELKNAEQKVRKLTEDGSTEDFDADDLV